MGEITKYSKAAALFMLLVLFINPVFAERASADSEDASAASSVSVTESAQSSVGDENSIVLTDSSENASGGISGGLNGIWVFIRMLLVLAVVVAIIWFMFRYLKKKTMPEDNNGEPDPFLRKVSSVTLAPGKSVQIVTLIDKAYILGVADDSINLISEVDNKELVQDMNLYADKNQNQKRAKSFDELLEIFMPKKKSGSVQKSSSQSAYGDGSTDKLLNSLKNKHLSSEE